MGFSDILAVHTVLRSMKKETTVTAKHTKSTKGLSRVSVQWCEHGGFYGKGPVACLDMIKT